MLWLVFVVNVVVVVDVGVGVDVNVDVYVDAIDVVDIDGIGVDRCGGLYCSCYWRRRGVVHAFECWHVWTVWAMWERLF